MSTCRILLAVLFGLSIGWSERLMAQATGKPARIGFLETISAALNEANMVAFRAGMASRQYSESTDYIIEYRSADGQTQKFAELARELVDARVDIIVTRGTPAAIAARDATRSIPIVMSAIGDPLQVVSSLARPDGNVTGLTSLTQELAAKRLSLLRDLVPGVRCVGALLNMDNPTLITDWKTVQATASSLGWRAVLLDVRTGNDIAAAFDRARGTDVDAVIVSTDAVTQANRELITQLAAKYLMPTIYPSREFVDAGGLIMYGVSYPDLYRRAALYVDRILNGSKPGDLPIEQPLRFELIINQKAASSLGLSIPQAMLALADQVVE